MPPVGFEPAIPASERPQTYALDRAATGTGEACILYRVIYCVVFSDNCIQPDDGQKLYWPKHVVDMLCIIENIVVL